MAHEIRASNWWNSNFTDFEFFPAFRLSKARANFFKSAPPTARIQTSRQTRTTWSFPLDGDRAKFRKRLPGPKFQANE